ncbi:MAG: mechanosensitive ion channel family protein [Halanaerobium sp.]
MDYLLNSYQKLLLYLPFLLFAVFLGLIVRIAHWYLIKRHSDLGNEKKFSRQIIIVVLFFLNLLIFVLLIPIGEETRKQLISLIGILLSGVIAFSSTTIVANLMAGILLRITKPFKLGDFITVDNYFGRVSQRGLFDTEIQTESRELIALPNVFLINKPVKTVRSSGVMVSAEISLGYDIHHSKIEELLVKAAEEAELKDAFVRILELGNFSVSYKISAFLEDTKNFLTANSRLRKEILNTMHKAEVEIVSPTFTNQRRFEKDEKFISKKFSKEEDEQKSKIEKLIFDKAEEAAKIEEAKEKIAAEIELLEESLKNKDVENKDKLKNEIELAKERFKALESAENKLELEEK